VQEPAVHRGDQRIAVRCRCGDGDGLHAIEQPHDLARAQGVAIGMGDVAHVRTDPGMAAVDARLELVELSRGLTHRDVVPNGALDGSEPVARHLTYRRETVHHPH
jgi:hypothetical protein